MSGSVRNFLIGKPAQNLLVKYLSEIAYAVGSTMGPGGRPFGFDKKNTSGHIAATFSKDGLTVLRALEFSDPAKAAVLQYAKNASSHSVLASGDGPQPLWSKVLTPTGFIPMDEVQSGMMVCGTDGTIQKVVSVHEKGEREIFEVEFANAGIVECCSDHLWTVTDNYLVNKSYKTKTTGELFKDYHRVTPAGDNHYRYYTPKALTEGYSDPSKMPLDPYLLGVLLGDGSLSGTGTIEISLGLKKEHIINKLALPAGIYLDTKWVERKNYFRIKINGRADTTGCSIAEILEQVGLYGTKSKTKFIPKAYLYSSKEDRLALLQGLLDTDGNYSPSGLFSLSTVSDQLSKDFMDLCRSLGYSINYWLHERKEGKSYSMTPIHRMSQLKGYKYGDKIIRITPTGRKTQMKCIKVSNSNNLYITDNYVVTHNTTSTIVVASAVANAVLSSEAKYPQAFARQLEADGQRAIQAIRKEAIKSDDAVKTVALTSANGDQELADVVLKAINMSSALGTLLVDKNALLKDRYTISRQDGYSNAHGYNYNVTFAGSASPVATASKPIVWQNPVVALFNGALMTTGQLTPIVKAWEQYNKDNEPTNLVIMAYEVADEVCNTLMVINRTIGATSDNNEGVRAFVIRPKLTQEANSGIQIMRDYAAYCGIADEKIIDGASYKTMDKTYLGTCGTVKISLGLTQISGRANNHWVDKRVAQNQSIVEEARSEFDKLSTGIRNAELAEGLVKVEIGGGNMADLQERADRFDDASKAAQACMLHGALPGGGASYIRAAELVGAHPALQLALRSVYNTVLTNYGVDPQDDFSPGPGIGVAITDNGWISGFATDLKVLDSAETVCAVIKNGVDLGVQIATIGGFSYRQGSEVNEYE